MLPTDKLVYLYSLVVISYVFMCSLVMQCVNATFVINCKHVVMGIAIY